MRFAVLFCALASVSCGTFKHKMRIGLTTFHHAGVILRIVAQGLCPDVLPPGRLSDCRSAQKRVVQLLTTAQKSSAVALLALDMGDASSLSQAIAQTVSALMLADEIVNVWKKQR